MSEMANLEHPTPKRGWLEVSRSRAFLTHLGISASIVGLVCALIFFVWYPHPYFQATGAWHVLRVLIGVDLVVGPLLTLIVFKPGKWGLKFDLCVIALVQLTALIYGVSVIYMERPYFTVFAVDRFYVLAHKDVDQTQLADRKLTNVSRLGAKPLVGPLLVVATRPSDTAGMQRLVDETVFGSRPDIERRPEFWSAYAEQTSQVLARSRPIATLKAQRPRAARDIDRLVAALGRPEDELAFLPIIAKNRDLSMIIDTSDGMPLDVLDVDPWVNAE
ncbi:MAG TPA: TfpX/TfpZ family type IV pilin accessory protein [Gammaproteobacteria bacterium]|nr:TfpX/TfpZ family type IV pilin accessory protein [Gammaproteobacteria bacterium]